MRVYYLTGAQYGLSNLALQRIKVSRFRDLNDPFELLGVNLADKQHRAAFRLTKQEIDNDKGLICFSKNWRNPVLWGHYGERHTGMALGFDVPNEMLVPVIYAKKLLEINLDPKTKRPQKELVDRLIRTKFYDWKYEDEMRLFVELDHDNVESGMYFCSFSKDLTLRDVILGPRCELPIEGVRGLVANLEPEVQVLQSRIAFTRFEVLESKAALRVDAKPAEPA